MDRMEELQVDEVEPVAATINVTGQPGLLAEYGHHARHTGTALTLAAEAGHAHVVGMLIDCPGVALAHQRTCDGKTALHLACEGGHLGCAEAISNAIIQSGGEVDAVDGCGDTALVGAIRSNRVEIVKGVVGTAAEPGPMAELVLRENGLGETALQVAERLNMEFGQGGSPFPLAASNAIVRCLLAALPEGVAVVHKHECFAQGEVFSRWTPPAAPTPEASAAVPPDAATPEPAVVDPAAADQAEEEMAATAIQNAHRSRSAKKKVAKKREARQQGKAATKLQAAQRGRSGRKKARAKRAKSKK